MPIVVEILPVICDLTYNRDACKWAFTVPSRIPAIRVRVGIVLSELFFRPWNLFVKRFPGTQVVFGEPQFCPRDTRCARPKKRELVPSPRCGESMHNAGGVVLHSCATVRVRVSRCEAMCCLSGRADVFSLRPQVGSAMDSVESVLGDFI